MATTKKAPAKKQPAAKKPAAKKAAPKKPAAKKAPPAPKKDKYLVTGACGFTGSHLCEILSERDLDFVATDIAGANTSVLPPGAEFIPSDLTDIESLKKVVKGCTVVLHPAAIFDWSTPIEVLEAVNVKGTENLCEAAKAAGVRRLVSWSTSGVYGSQKFDELPIREDYPKDPIEDYSITKHQQDQVAHSYNNPGGMTTSIIRPGIVYGPRSVYGAGQIFELFSTLPIIPVPINFKYRFGVIHVRDIAGAAIFVSGKAEAADQEYGVVDCSDISIADFLKLVASAMGKPVLPVYAPPMIVRSLGLLAADIAEWAAKLTNTRPLLERGPVQFFPVDLYISNRKLRDLGYEFEYPTPDRGVAETVEWARREGMAEKTIFDVLKKTIAKR